MADLRTNRSDLLDAIKAVLPDAPPGMTVEQIWNAVPGEVRKSVNRMRDILNGHVEELWKQETGEGRGKANAYWRMP